MDTLLVESNKIIPQKCIVVRINKRFQLIKIKTNNFSPIVNQCFNVSMNEYIRYLNILMHNSFSTSVHQYINTSVHQCTSALMHQCTKTPKHQCTNEPMYQCTNVPMHQCTNAPMHQYITASLHHCITALFSIGVMLNLFLLNQCSAWGHFLQ